MSTTIDERVVEMRFDNKQFESNVATSMSTLEKLKQKLNLSGASKGLEDVNAAAKRVDMSGLGGAVDTIKAKFSAMDVVAVTALANITNSAVNTGKRLVSSLSVDQVKEGWKKFSDKTTSVATLVAQGNAIGDVNKQLDRLNWFTDETSYNFTDMVSNIAKFTATGKGLDESVTAMEGIATWAALSGQNAQTASHAMYQLSQAMGAGVMRLEDYKSIQNASMDTEEFRQKCIDAAIELGTLQEVSEGVYQSLVATGKGAESFNISQFTTKLTDGAWMTSEVMMEVFNDYSAAVNGIYEAAEEKGMLASEVIDEIYDTAESGGISVDEAIQKLGYSFDSFALKAFEAAQKARTFSDAIDSVKDAVSTGWMNTFELIFGDAEQATKLWTDVANQLYDVFAAGGERRNEILENTMISKWDTLIERVNDAGVETDKFEQKVAECAEAGGIDVDKLTDKYGTLSEAFKQGAIDVKFIKEAVDLFNGAIGETADESEKAAEAVKKISVDLSDIFESNSDKVIPLWSPDAEAVRKIQTALTELGFELPVYGIDGLNGPETKKAIEEFQQSVGLAVTGVVDEATVNAMMEMGGAIEEIGDAAAKSEIEVDDLIDGIGKMSGQELVFETIHNVLEGIVGILTAFRDAWAEVFSVERASSGLYNFLDALHSLSEKLVLSENSANKLKSTFKGVIAIFDILTSIVGGALKAAFDIIGAVFDAFSFDALIITKNIGDVISAFRDWIDENEVISTFFEAVVEGAKSVIGVIKSWITAFKEIPIVKNFLFEIHRKFIQFSLSAKDMDFAMRRLKKRFENFGNSDFVQGALAKIQAAFETITKDYIPNAITALGTWFEGFKETKGVKQLINAVESLYNALAKLFKGEINSSEFAASLGENLGKALASLPAIAGQLASDFLAGFTNGLGDGVSGVISKIVDFCASFISAFASALGIHSPSVISFEKAVQWIQGFINGLIAMIGSVINVLKEIGAKIVEGFSNGIDDNSGSILDVLKNIGAKIVEFFKGLWEKAKNIISAIDWKKVFAGAMLVGGIWFLKKVGDFFGSLTGLFKSIGGVFESFSGVLDGFKGVLKSFSKVLNGIAWDFKAKALLKMAAAIAILVACVWALTKVDDLGKLWNAVGVIAVLAVILAALAFAMNKISAASMSFDLKNGFNLDGLQTTILQIGIAIALIAFAVKMLGKIPEPEATAGFIRLGAIVVGMLAFMAALSLISRAGKDVDKFSNTMIKLSAAMLIMIIVIKKIAGMKPDDIVIGIAVMEAFVLLMIQMGIANRIAGKNGEKFGSNVLKVSIAMGILVLVMKMLSGMDPGDIVVGIAVLEAFVLLMLEMAVVNRIAGSGKSKIGSAVMSMAASMIILTGVIWLLSKLDESAIDNGIRVMQKFVLVIAELVLVSKLAGKENAKIAGNILAMSIAIGILAAIAWLLGSVPIENLERGVTVVAILGLIMAAMVRACRGANDVKGSVYAMAAVIGVLVLAVYALTTIEDGRKLAGATAAIGALMLIFGLMAKLSTSAKITKGTIGSLGAMAGVVIILAGILVLLCKLDINKALEVASSLGIMLLAFSMSLKIMSTISYVSKSAYAGMVAMVIVLAVLAVILGVLCSFDVSSALEVAVSLSMLLLSLSAACLVLAVSSAIMTAASAGIGGMIAVIVAVGLLMAAIAGLVTLFPGLESFMSKALPILKLLGQGLGEFLGGIITAVGQAYLGLLEQLGTSLSNFMTNVQPFLDGLRDIDASVLAGVGYLAATILALTVADVIAGVGSLMTFGQGSFATIAAGLTQLGDGAAAFFAVANSVDSNAVEAAKNVAAMILALSAANFVDAMTTMFGGSTDYSSFGSNLKSFGEAVVEFSDIVNGKINTEAVESAANAGKMLAELNKSLPRSGGIVQDFLGEQDFTAFSTGCKAFADCMVEISGALNQEGFDIPSEKIGQMTTAGTQFSDLNAALPRSGGMLQDFIGEQDLAAFGQACQAFATCMISISATLSSDDVSIESDKLAQLTTAGTQFSDLNTALPRSGGMVQDFIGEQDLAAFGEACKAFATCMISINGTLSGDDVSIESDKLTQLATAGTQFSTLNGALPRSDGFIQDFIGEQDLAAFGEACKAFATCMIDISSNLAEFTVDTDKFTALKDAGTALADLQETLPKSGGWWQSIAGESDIADFGSKIKSFGTAMSDFSDSVEGFSVESFDNSMAALKSMKEFMDGCTELDTSGWNELVGTGSIYGNSISQLGITIAGFASTISEVDTSAVATAVTAAIRLKNLINSLADLDNSGIDKFTPARIGRSMQAYAESVASFDNASVSDSISAAYRIKTLINSLKDLDDSGISNFTPLSIGNSIKNYSDKVAGIDVAAIANSISAATKIKSFISSLSGLKTSGVASFSAAVTRLSKVNFSGIAAMMNSYATTMQSSGQALMNSLNTGMQAGLAVLLPTLDSVVNTMIARLRSKSNAFKTAGVTFAKGIRSGFSSNSNTLPSAARTAASKMVSAVRGYWSSFFSAGEYLVRGFASGVKLYTYVAEEASRQMAKKAKEAAEKELGEQSPSKVFKQIGAYATEGFAIGLDSLGNKVEGSARNMADKAINTTRAAMTTVLDTLNSDIDSQPTIRPVVDLSDVRTGADAISGMFGGIQTVGVRSNLAAIDTAMNAKLQNGSNSDVVSAINKLGTGLENARGDTYNFGGFTYDDGSNVSDAVETLIRYARIGRRR